ncbi:MAG: DUF72 domain-containing protein [Terriglobia bacterium]
MPPPSAIRVGPAGWSYQDWAGIVYPRRRPAGFHEATYLADYFDTVEINVSFYRPLTPAMTRGWLARVASNPRFLFTAKLWQRFTHEREYTAADVREFRQGMDVLLEAGKLGALLLQFPFSFKNTPEERGYLLELGRTLRDFPLVVEVRHASWNDAAFYETLTEDGIGFCNIDQPVIGRSLKPTEKTTAAVGYVRLHGRNYREWFADRPDDAGAERYNYLYSLEELKPWAARIEHVAADARLTFVITNNHFRGQAVTNALQLIHLLTQKPVRVPPPLLQHYPELEPLASPAGTTPSLFSTNP